MDSEFHQGRMQTSSRTLGEGVGDSGGWPRARQGLMVRGRPFALEKLHFANIHANGAC